MRIISAISALLLLSSCAMLPSWVPGSSPPDPLDDKGTFKGSPSPRETICKFNNESLGLPITVDIFKTLESDSKGRSALQSVPVAVASNGDKRAILKLNLKHVCMCGTQSQRTEAKCPPRAGEE